MSDNADLIFFHPKDDDENLALARKFMRKPQAERPKEILQDDAQGPAGPHQGGQAKPGRRASESEPPPETRG